MSISRGRDFALRFGEGGHRKRLIFTLNRSILSLFYDLDPFCEVCSRSRSRSILGYLFFSILTCVIFVAPTRERVMDKEWMYKMLRLDPAYIEHLTKFISAAKIHRLSLKAGTHHMSI